ncbi:MAG TPA: hypothetical protein VLF21_02330 [Candidatus Saccharimonadales bacterium]|nr:hypothetical protein [Candidatus Saccharimonadales bacterium]
MSLIGWIVVGTGAVVLIAVGFFLLICFLGDPDELRPEWKRHVNPYDPYL